MQITWYGHECFRLRGRGCALVTDPYAPELGYRLPRMRATVVTISHDHPHHNYLNAVRGDYYTIRGPGEYEVGGIYVAGIRADGNTGSPRNRQGNVAYLIEIEGVNVCHLGALDHPLTQQELEPIDDVDVLLLPVGGHGVLNASKAAELINQLEPSYVIPMHYRLPDVELSLDPCTRFFKELAIKKPRQEETLDVTAGRASGETRVVELVAKR